MPLLESTRNHQSELAMFCRTGQYHPIPGVNEDHVVQYRKLVYNVVDDTLQSAFPLTRNLLSLKEWNKLVQDFFSSHACHSPQVWTMPKELWAWVVETPPSLLKKYQFLDELLWFEWLEVELFMMEDRSSLHHPEGDLTKERLVLNPEHHLQHFTWPVHLKQAKHITPQDHGHYFLVMHREPATGKVIFTNLSPLLARMVELLAEAPLSMEELIRTTSSEFNIIPDQSLHDGVFDFITNSLSSALISGFATPHNS
jgi:hypothetical protein